MQPQRHFKKKTPNWKRRFPPAKLGGSTGIGADTWDTTSEQKGKVCQSWQLGFNG